MNCRRAKKLVYDFIDGLCSETEQVELEHHLSDCEPCERHASQLTRSLDMLRRAPVEPVDDSFNWRVRLAIRKELSAARGATTSQRGLFRRWNIGYAASAVAGFAVILVAGWVAIGSMDKTASHEFEGLSQDKMPTVETRTIQPATGELAARRANSPLIVSQDGRLPVRSNDAVRGAIDMLSTASRDSLVRAAVQGMTQEERMRYFRAQISRLQRQMENRNTKNR